MRYYDYTLPVYGQGYGGLMKIVLVDDHPVVRKGLKSILEEESGYVVCGEAEDGNNAIRIIADTEPDLVIVDIELKGNIDGIELVGAIKGRFPGITVLVMSMDDGTLYAERSIKAGAKGYIAKAEAAENILTAIESVMDNRIYLSSSISNKIATKHIYGSPDNGKIEVHLLSSRELEIFQLIGKGYKRNEIAKRLNININTMESHRRKILEKLAIENSSELTKLAVQWGVSEKR
jgi:DNA-binding NarL/FixJ family response regulator